jgi:iron complex transport system permease protein
VLAGVALTALSTSATTVLVLVDAETPDAYRFWVLGSLSGRDPTLLVSVLPLLLTGAGLVVATTRSLDLLSLGDDLARGLGARLAWGRPGVGLSATLLTAAATAVAGPLVFVGLTVPHLARALTGPAARWLLPVSALLGAALLVTRRRSADRATTRPRSRTAAGAAGHRRPDPAGPGRGLSGRVGRQLRRAAAGGARGADRTR